MKKFKFKDKKLWEALKESYKETLLEGYVECDRIQAKELRRRVAKDLKQLSLDAIYYIAKSGKHAVPYSYKCVYDRRGIVINKDKKYVMLEALDDEIKLNPNASIAIFDDVLDSGFTLRIVYEALRASGFVGKIYFVCLVARSDSFFNNEKRLPNTYGAELIVGSELKNEHYILFYWEANNDDN